uniref:Transcriptional regulator n=1 Tax=Heterorhabditis bacteriophora TaxID=37862 RepID=A0A1I7WLQ3_HETBA
MVLLKVFGLALYPTTKVSIIALLSASSKSSMISGLKQNNA